MCVSRCGAIFSGVFCLIQGFVWLGLCIVGLLAFKCNFQVDNKEVEVFLDIYFNHGLCEGATHSELGDILQGIIPEPPHVEIVPDITTFPPYPEWPVSTPAAGRTQVLLVIYVVLTASWIFTSVMLTIGASIESKGPTAAFFYLPWITITFLICVTDVVSTILYALDIPKTTTFLDFLRFIGFNTAGLEHYQQLTQTQIFTTVPAIVMTVVCARGVLLWLFNLILLLTTILALKNNLENYKVKKNKQKEGEWRDVSRLWLTEPPPRKDSTESIPPNGAASNPWNMRSKNVPPPARVYDSDRNANMNQMGRTFHDFLSRGEDEGRSSFRENGPPPAELRSELPWSYFSHRDDLKGPPKRNKNVLEPMPPVPPPDYTLKFPQYTRPVINRNSDYRSSWSSKDGSNLPSPEPFIPAPDYERRRLPPRMMGRQLSEESNNSQPSQSRYGTRQPPHIPQPDYDQRRAPPNSMKPTMKQELQQMIAARGRTNPGYISTEDDGYRQPHVPTTDYAKPRKVMQKVEDLEHRNDDYQRGNMPHIISGGHNPNKVTGRARHYGYF